MPITYTIYSPGSRTYSQGGGSAFEAAAEQVLFGNGNYLPLEGVGIHPWLNGIQDTKIPSSLPDWKWLDPLKTFLGYCFGAGEDYNVTRAIDWFAQKVRDNPLEKEITLDLLGHSRGSLQSLRIAHEIYRWVENYNEDKADAEKIKVSVNLLLTDPVPGPFKGYSLEHNSFAPNVSSAILVFAAQEDNLLFMAKGVNEIKISNNATRVTSFCVNETHRYMQRSRSSPNPEKNAANNFIGALARSFLFSTNANNKENTNDNASQIKTINEDRIQTFLDKPEQKQINTTEEKQKGFFRWFFGGLKYTAKSTTTEKSEHTTSLAGLQDLLDAHIDSEVTVTPIAAQAKQIAANVHNYIIGTQHQTDLGMGHKNVIPSTMEKMRNLASSPEGIPAVTPEGRTQRDTPQNRVEVIKHQAKQGVKKLLQFSRSPATQGFYKSFADKKSEIWSLPAAEREQKARDLLLNIARFIQNTPDDAGRWGSVSVRIGTTEKTITPTMDKILTIIHAELEKEIKGQANFTQALFAVQAIAGESAKNKMSWRNADITQFYSDIEAATIGSAAPVPTFTYARPAAT